MQVRRCLINVLGKRWCCASVFLKCLPVPDKCYTCKENGNSLYQLNQLKLKWPCRKKIRIIPDFLEWRRAKHCPWPLQQTLKLPFFPLISRIGPGFFSKYLANNELHSIFSLLIIIKINAILPFFSSLTALQEGSQCFALFHFLCTCLLYTSPSPRD